MKFNKEEKAMWLEDWRQSGKKAWTYAKENGLIPQTFCRWVKQNQELKKDEGFVEITGEALIPIVPKQEIILEKGGVNLRIPLGISSEELRMIFRIVGIA